MNIEYPLHALTGVSFPSERTPNNPNDTHYSVFDSKHGCVAHVFDERLAIKMAAAPEMLDELRLIRGYFDAIRNLTASIAEHASASSKIERLDQLITKATGGDPNE